MTHRLERHFREAGTELAAIRVECRITTCRPLLEHAVHSQPPGAPHVKVFLDHRESGD